MTSSPLAVHARKVSRIFPNGEGLRRLDVDIEPGTVFGFIGPSGSGKTTTIRLMTGVLFPDSGELTVLGKRPGEFRRTERGRLGYLPQLSILYPELSLWENLGFCASLFSVPWRGRRKRMERVLDLVELGEARRRLMREASGGMQRRLSLAATLIHDPELLFLDEPTAGVDPLLRRKLWDHFSVLRDDGRTLFITTQYVTEAAYCDLVGILAEGRLLTVDSPEELRRRAFGGEVVDVTLARPVQATSIEEIAHIAGASSYDRLDPNRIRLVVTSASDVSPKITSWSSQNGNRIESVDQHLPPFDDVFVELIDQLGSHRSESTGV